MIWPYYVVVIAIFLITKNKYYSTCCTNGNANLHLYKKLFAIKMIIMIVVLVHNDMFKMYPLVCVCVCFLSAVCGAVSTE